MLQAESTGEICVKIRTLGHLMLSEYSLAWARFTFIVLIAEIAKCGIVMIISELHSQSMLPKSRYDGDNVCGTHS